MDEPKDLQNNIPSEKETKLDPFHDVEIPNLRTYKSDISHTVQTDRVTSAKILMSEQRKRELKSAEENATSLKKPTNTFALIFGLLFGIAAIGMLGYFGYSQMKNTKAPITTFKNEYLFAFIFDDQKLIDTSKSKIEIYQNVENILSEAANQKNNTYTDIVFFKTDQETKENERITTAQFFTLYDIALPFTIANSISKDFVYGIYKTSQKAEPFLIVGLVDYENAYDSMFDWEDLLAYDLKAFFPNIQKILNPPVVVNTIAPSANEENATSTESATTTQANTQSASSTEQISGEEFSEPLPEVVRRKVEFTDIVFSNKDTRTARDDNGNPFFYYAFIERDKILFAQDPVLVGEIIRKVKERQLIR